MIKKYIPNFLTLLNLFCGCIALVFVADSNYKLAFFFVALGIFFDFFDGFFARKFNVAGPLGVQLDSLADMVTSGVVPGFLVYKILANNYMLGAHSYLPYFGFVITLGACYRLAKFNIDTRQSDTFIGLPTPANTLFFLSLPLINWDQFSFGSSNTTLFCTVLIALCFLSAYVMNAEIPLFSLKIKNFSLSKYKLQVLFVLSAIILVAFFGYLGVAGTILFYVILSVLNNLFLSKK